MKIEKDVAYDWSILLEIHEQAFDRGELDKNLSINRPFFPALAQIVRWLIIRSPIIWVQNLWAEKAVAAEAISVYSS